jgi:phosphoribosyl 1,2-cyclic phosphodiesterase
MTTLYVLGSGSSGNAFAIGCEGQALLVDAGFSAREIAQRAERVGFDLSRLVGIAITHEHGDHTSGVARLARQLKIPVLAAVGTWDRLRPRMPKVDFVPLRLMHSIEHRGFRVEACPTSHDAAQPVALAVTTVTGYRVAVAYDLGRPTTAVRLLLRNAHAIVLEANYDDVLLRTSGYPASVQARIAGSGGHLSNRAAAELLGDVVHEGLELVVLAHLSERCNTGENARAAMAPVLRRRGCALHVAKQHEALPALELRGTGLLL